MTNLVRPVGRIVIRGEEGQPADLQDGLIVGACFTGGQDVLKPGMVFEIVEVNRGLRLRPVGQSCIRNFPRPEEGIELCWQHPLDLVLEHAGAKVCLTDAELAPPDTLAEVPAAVDDYLKMVNEPADGEPS